MKLYILDLSISPLNFHSLLVTQIMVYFFKSILVVIHVHADIHVQYVYITIYGVFLCLVSHVNSGKVSPTVWLCYAHLYHHYYSFI